MLVFTGIVTVFWFVHTPSLQEDTFPAQHVPTSTNGVSYKDATYTIEGTMVTLQNGVSEMRIPGTDSKIVTRYFGNEAYADFDGDGRTDVVFLMTQEGSGSGVFFYVVVALNTPEGYVGTIATFLGDRIAPQNINVNERGHIIVNYADRNVGEPMTTPPSVGVSRRLIYDGANAPLGEVVQDFEGEANPEMMMLDMKMWILHTHISERADTISRNTDAFTLTFLPNGTVEIGSDCGKMNGTYTIEASHMSITDIQKTSMVCSQSQEEKFATVLSAVTEYHFTSRGKLVLDTLDRGSLSFR